MMTTFNLPTLGFFLLFSWHQYTSIFYIMYFASHFYFSHQTFYLFLLSQDSQEVLDLKDGIYQ